MRSQALLLQLLVGSALVAAAAAASSATEGGAFEWGGGVEHRDDSGLVCDSSEAQRGLVLERALGALRDDFDVQKGNLSFHLGGNPAGRYGVSMFCWCRFFFSDFTTDRVSNAPKLHRHRSLCSPRTCSRPGLRRLRR